MADAEDRPGISSFAVVLELYLWAGLAVILTVPVWLDYPRYAREFPPGEGLRILVSERYYSFLLGFVALLFPLVFRLIFDAYPLQALRARSQARTHRLDVPTTIGSKDSTIADARSDGDRRPPSPVPSSPQEMLAVLAADSKDLSERIYTRAGVYLLVGVFIALTGLAFFYLQSVAIGAPKDLATLLAALAPRIGILFFIELVAFFFLRQYRAAMDDFRYFEAIKRN